MKFWVGLSFNIFILYVEMMDSPKGPTVLVLDVVHGEMICSERGNVIFWCK